MNSTTDSDARQNPENPELELHALVSAYVDEQLNDAQWEYLSKKPGDQDFWSEWQDILRTEHAMLVGLEPEANVIPLPAPHDLTLVDRGHSSHSSHPHNSSESKSWLPKVALGLAAAVAIFVGGTWLMKPATPDPISKGLVIQNTQEDRPATTSGLHLFASSLVNCRWTSEEQRIFPGDNLMDNHISMQSGVMKIHFPSGRMVILSGEVDATFKTGKANSTLLDLRHGELAVIGGDHDSPSDHGFFIQTPRGLLEEIGTEFVVEVGDEDEVNVTVESGEVGVTGKDNFTLKAKQSANLSHNGVTREDRSFNKSERKLFDLMPEDCAGPANIIHYDPAKMGNDIYKIILPDSLLLVKEKQNVLIEEDMRFNIDTPGTYAFYRHGEEYRPAGWKMPKTERQGAGTRVDSYLVQFNPSVEQLEDIQVYGYIDFDQPIQAIHSGGWHLTYWDKLFALPKVRYWRAGWLNADLIRGLESTSLSGGVANIADVITLSEDRKRLTLRLCASVRLDQIRVLLKSEQQ